MVVPGFRPDGFFGNCDSKNKKILEQDVPLIKPEWKYFNWYISRFKASILKHKIKKIKSSFFICMVIKLE